MKKLLLAAALLSSMGLTASVTMSLDVRIGQESMAQSFDLNDVQNLCFVEHNSGVITSLLLKEQHENSALIQVAVLLVEGNVQMLLYAEQVEIPFGDKKVISCPAEGIDATVEFVVTKADEVTIMPVAQEQAN